MATAVDVSTSRGVRPASTAAIWAAMVVVYLVWGSTYLGIRVVVQAGIPPMLGMAARFLAAGALLALILVARSGVRRLRVTRRQLLGAGVVGTLLLAGNGIVAVAEETVPSGLAALLVGTVPLLFILLRVLGGERPRWLTWFGVLVGFAGVALLTASGGETSAEPLGIALVIIAAGSWAIGSHFSSRLGLPKDSLVASVYEMLLGGLMLVLFGLLRGETAGLDTLREIDRSGWLALLYLTGFGSVLAYSAYSFLLANAPISLVGTYAYVNPAVAVFLGWLILSEEITTTIAVGGAIVVLGVALVVTAERRRR